MTEFGKGSWFSSDVSPEGEPQHPGKLPGLETDRLDIDKIIEQVDAEITKDLLAVESTNPGLIAPTEEQIKFGRDIAELAGQRIGLHRFRDALNQERAKRLQD